MVKASRLLAALILMLLCLPLYAADIRVQVDRNPVQLNESFRIIFQSDGSVDDDPDFSPLENDFDILNRNQSSSMQIVNGNVSRNTQWVLQVMAKHEGALTIPSVSFGSDKTEPMIVRVNPASRQIDKNSGSEDLFLKSSVDIASPYVQTQIIYTLRFYRAVNIGNASLSDLEVTGGEAIVEQLGEDNTFETTVNGRRYVVVERRFTIFPQGSGSLTIEPAVLDAQVTTNSRSHVFRPFDQNFRTVRVHSEKIELDVKAIPAEMQGKPWIAARSVHLQEEWSQSLSDFIVGEPATRTLTLRAVGLTAAQLPELYIPQLDGLNQYPDQPKLHDSVTSQGISGTRQEKIAFIPTKAGSLEMPEIKLDWWNIETDSMETITIPARRVSVSPAAQSSSDTAITAPVNTQTVVTTQISAGYWPWVALILGLGWLATIGAWVYQVRNRRIDAPIAQPNRESPAASLRDVQRACRNNDPQAAKTALLAWGKRQWPEKPPGSLGDIAAHFDKETQALFAELNRVLYAGNERASWQGDALFSTLERAVKEKKGKNKKDEPVLVPLYP